MGQEVPEWIDTKLLNLVYNKQDMVEQYIDGGDEYILYVGNTLASKGIEMTPHQIKDASDELITYYYILMDNFDQVEHLLEDWDNV